jgi:hypothetical protein
MLLAAARTSPMLAYAYAYAYAMLSAATLSAHVCYGLNEALVNIILYIILYRLPLSLSSYRLYYTGSLSDSLSIGSLSIYRHSLSLVTLGAPSACPLTCSSFASLRAPVSCALKEAL